MPKVQQIVCWRHMLQFSMAALFWFLWVRFWLPFGGYFGSFGFLTAPHEVHNFLTAPHEVHKKAWDWFAAPANLKTASLLIACFIFHVRLSLLVHATWETGGVPNPHETRGMPATHYLLHWIIYPRVPVLLDLGHSGVPFWSTFLSKLAQKLNNP